MSDTPLGISRVISAISTLRGTRSSNTAVTSALAIMVCFSCSSV